MVATRIDGVGVAFQRLEEAVNGGSGSRWVRQRAP